MPGLPRVCWTVGVPTVEEVLRRARGLKPPSARFVEIRLDYLTDPARSADAIRGLKRLKIMTIATLRSVAAGGRFSGSVEHQLAVLGDCGQAGAFIVDLEIESAERAGQRAVAALRKPARLLISFHDYRETPEDLQGTVQRVRMFPADYYKIAAWSARHTENIALLALNSAPKGTGPARRRAGTLAFALGELGSPTRVLSPARGAPFTYAAVSTKEAVAPGQLTGDELLNRYRVVGISPKTAVYGVIGNPIAHSISPAVHNAAFQARRRDAVYLPFRVDSLEDFLQAVPGYRLAGFSVTVPHKEGMARAADWLDAEARDAGAVNTVVVRAGKLRGYNTDMAGIVVPLGKRMRLRGARVLVAGTGGAARAAAFALAREKARVVVTGRRPEQAVALAEAVGGEVIERHSLSGDFFDAIVHATPLGMYPDTESCFFSPGELNAPLLLETVYNPMETALLRLARKRRMQVIPGLEMFLEQAVRQFELWTGEKAPPAIMEKAAVEALRRMAPVPPAASGEAG